VMTSVGRPRPAHEFWLTGAGGQSFPSGHTTTATLGYGLLGYLLWRLCWKRWQRLALVGTGLVLAAAVGASRAYLGVHWVSDVVGGWSLGLFWLALVVGVVQVVQQRGWVSSNGRAGQIGGGSADHPLDWDVGFGQRRRSGSSAAVAAATASKVGLA
jgi:membrane-associated phospholipid phosphatase